MEVEQVTLLNRCPHRRVIFKTGVKCTESSWSEELEKQEFVTLAPERSRYAISAHCRHNQGDVPTRVPRSRSSPDRRSDHSKPRRSCSPSTVVLQNAALPTAPTIPSPLLNDYINNPLGALAFYSPRPPATPMYLVYLLPNPIPSSSQDTKTVDPTELQTKVKQDKKEKKSKKFKSKESKKVVRYVMQTLLRSVHSSLVPHAPDDASDFSSRVNTEDITPAKANPLFHSVASQTKQKPSFNRPPADENTDDLSISSEEHCTELDESCEWVGNVRALRDSHVRLVLRQLQHLRHIERLNRTLQRAHVAPQSPVQTPPIDSSTHSAC